MVGASVPAGAHPMAGTEAGPSILMPDLRGSIPSFRRRPESSHANHVLESRSALQKLWTPAFAGVTRTLFAPSSRIFSYSIHLTSSFNSALVDLNSLIGATGSCLPNATEIINCLSSGMFR